MFLVCKNLNLFTQGCSAPSLVEISSIYLNYFVIISPWKRTWPFICINLNSLHIRLLCTKIHQNWQSGSGELLSMYIWYSPIISSWNKAWPFIWRHLNPFQPKLLCAKFGWNWPTVSGEKMKMWKVYNDKGDNDED